MLLSMDPLRPVCVCVTNTLILKELYFPLWRLPFLVLLCGENKNAISK